MDDTWFSRDLIILEKIVELLDNKLQNGPIQLGSLVELTGLEISQVGRSATALDEAGFINLVMTMSGGNPAPWIVTSCSREARIAVGTWPSPEGLTSRILEALEERSKAEPNTASRNWLRSIVGGAGEVTKSTIQEILKTAVIRATLGA